jgi:hypothetical protein
MHANDKRMKIFGIDFTSRPRRSKPITCLEATLDGSTLRAEDLKEWSSFEEFERALQVPGPWIAGIDFPFGLSRTFIENIGWPQSWQGYVDYVRTLDRNRFRSALDEYRKHRPAGDKEHKRASDIAAGSISPQKLYGVPIGLMFFEGSPRLRNSGVTIPELQTGDPNRIVVEAYPGVIARTVIGRRSYKHDTKLKQTPERQMAREELITQILNGYLDSSFGLQVDAPKKLANDPTGDQLDALLCAIQAAWAWRNRENAFGVPNEIDPLEGWIFDPTLSKSGVK